jgi:hypothetical protein
VNNTHWGRFFAVVGAAFITGFVGGFGSAFSAAQDRLGATATAHDLIQAFNAAGANGVLSGLGLAVPAAGAFFVPPKKPEVSE